MIEKITSKRKKERKSGQKSAGAGIGRPLLYSLIFHGVIAGLSLAILPNTARLVSATPAVLEVELISEEDLVVNETDEQPEAAKPPPPPPPPPEPEVQAEPEEVIEEIIEPEPVAEIEVPKPENPEPEKVKEDKPKPIKSVRAPPPPPPQIVKPAIEEKPKKEEVKKKPDFASVLKTVEKLKDRPQPKPQPQPDKKKQDDKPKESLQSLVKKALKPSQKTPSKVPNISSALNGSELDRVRAQIAQCWNVPAGAQNAEDLIIEVQIEVAPDRNVIRANLVGNIQSDLFWRTAAESAIRAVLNPRCNPLDLPPEKYDTWRSIIFTFNPQEMFG